MSQTQHLELLSAWTWSEDFDLRSKLEELQEELEDFGFSDIVADPDLILRCATAILMGSPAIDGLIQLSGDNIRTNFERVQNGIKGAIDFELSSRYERSELSLTS